VLAPIGVRAGSATGAGPRFFGYVSQIRIHYWMTPDGKPAGHRDPIVGRRLPWTGGNYDVLRSLQWQIHAYGGVEAADVPDLGLPVHVFEPHPPFDPGQLYLVRPDGFVAARAAVDDAESLSAAMPNA
jgi:hypothetical protein